MVTNIPDMPPLSRMGEKDSGNSTRNAETEKRERRRREKCPKRCGPKTAVKRGPGLLPSAHGATRCPQGQTALDQGEVLVEIYLGVSNRS